VPPWWRPTAISVAASVAAKSVGAGGDAVFSNDHLACASSMAFANRGFGQGKPCAVVGQGQVGRWRASSQHRRSAGCLGTGEL
jgi:hypothetical protein